MMANGSTNPLTSGISAMKVTHIITRIDTASSAQVAIWCPETCSFIPNYSGPRRERGRALDRQLLGCVA